MNKIILLSVIILFIGYNANSQINIGGIPYSFSKENKNYIKKGIIYKNMPFVNIEKLKKEDEIDDIKGSKPWRFGKNIFTDIDIKKDGVVDVFKDKGKIWRIGVASKNALTINLTFDKYRLPEGAVLYIYNNKKTDVIGGFTDKNNRADSIFATTLVKGDSIIIEYFEPYNAEFTGILHLNRVTHGYRGVGAYTKDFGESGSCNMNVACPDAAEWSDEIRSVCMLVTGGSGFCTGALINNTQEDETPYILSANHCYSNASSLVFWFNWESTTCDNPITEPTYDALSGAVTVSKNSASDFWLIKINDIPPVEYNVFYAGWSIENKPSTSSVGIHHPNGDIKKISFDDEPCTLSDFNGMEEPNSHWKITSWDRETTTEPGSSGSPLFDQNHRIIGQLHGGWAACGNTDSDYYGNFAMSWNRGYTPETRLKDWLDPINAGVQTLDGYDPNIPLFDTDAQTFQIISPKDKIYKGEQSKVIIRIKNKGNNTLTNLKINYKIDNDNVIVKDWTGSLQKNRVEIVELSEIVTAYGQHKITVWTSMPNGTEDEYHNNDTLVKEFYTYEKIFSDDFEGQKLWDMTGEFEIDKPQVFEPETGNPNPATAYSGSNVLGTDLTGLGRNKGSYEQNLSKDEYYAISPVIDCAGFEEIYLTFFRYLNVERASALDHAGIDVYYTGEWVSVWENSVDNITDNDWIEQTIDISEYANDNNILIRFTLGQTGNFNELSGWNVDDFVVYGKYNSNLAGNIRSDDFKVYPNPNSGEFTLDFMTETNSDVKVVISDFYGKILYDTNIKANEFVNFDMNSYKKRVIKVNTQIIRKGIYLLTVYSGDKVYTEKIFLNP